MTYAILVGHTASGETRCLDIGDYTLAKEKFKAIQRAENEPSEYVSFDLLLSSEGIVRRVKNSNYDENVTDGQVDSEGNEGVAKRGRPRKLDP